VIASLSQRLEPCLHAGEKASLCKICCCIEHAWNVKEGSMSVPHDTLPVFPSCYKRRAVLQAALGLGVMLPCRRQAIAQETEPRNLRPQAGDQLVFSSGEQKGVVIMPAQLQLEEAPVTAYPIDLGTGVIRDGSRLNQVILLRLDPAELSDATRARAAQGVVAYSAICTHTGCDAWLWQRDSKTLKCPCHDSEFDPKEEARVIRGPASRRLPALPLKVDNDILMVGSGFVGRVGFKQD
jgi:Rieske Fe-S protein